MRIVCPACTAAYEVPISLLKPGQVVRCARCAKEWTPAVEAEMPAVSDELPPPPPPATPVEEVAPPEIAVRPMARAAPPQTVAAPASSSIGLRLAWAASIVALGVLLALAYVERAAVMQAWPPSVRLYAALGLAANR